MLLVETRPIGALTFICRRRGGAKNAALPRPALKKGTCLHHITIFFYLFRFVSSTFSRIRGPPNHCFNRARYSFVLGLTLTLLPRQGISIKTICNQSATLRQYLEREQSFWVVDKDLIYCNMSILPFCCLLLLFCVNFYVSTPAQSSGIVQTRTVKEMFISDLFYYTNNRQYVC